MPQSYPALREKMNVPLNGLQHDSKAEHIVQSCGCTIDRFKIITPIEPTYAAFTKGDYYDAIAYLVYEMDYEVDGRVILKFPGSTKPNNAGPGCGPCTINDVVELAIWSLKVIQSCGLPARNELTDRVICGVMKTVTDEERQAIMERMSS